MLERTVFNFQNDTKTTVSTVLVRGYYKPLCVVRNCQLYSIKLSYLFKR